MYQAEQQARDQRIDGLGMSKYGPVDARVFVHSPNVWYQRIEINKGKNDGVGRADPVINGAGLVGKVEDVIGGGSAVVTLITDQSFATGAYAGESRIVGSITPAVGAPGDLLFEPQDADAKVREGDFVYTSGTTDTTGCARATPRPSRSAACRGSTSATATSRSASTSSRSRTCSGSIAFRC